MGMVLADQIVYLDRPSNGPTWEPFFNPNVVNASIGEKVQFIARIGSVMQNAGSDVLFRSWINLKVVLCPYELGIFGNKLLQPMCL